MSTPSSFGVLTQQQRGRSNHRRAAGTRPTDQSNTALDRDAPDGRVLGRDFDDVPGRLGRPESKQKFWTVPERLHRLEGEQSSSEETERKSAEEMKRAKELMW